MNGFDADAAFRRLDHVVDRQARHRHRGQRFHLDPGRAGDLHGGAHDAAGQLLVGHNIHGDFRQRQRMAQRDQIRGAFRRHDAGDARGSQHVALLGIAGNDQIERRLAHDDAAFRDRYTLGGRFGRDVDHAGLTPGVDMGEG